MSASARRPRAGLFAAATLALAALTLAACGNDDASGTRDEGAANSSSTAPESGQEKSGAGEAAGGTDGAGGGDPGGSSGGEGSGSSGAKENSGGGTGSDPHDPANRVPCTADNTSVTATPVSRPLNYMLLTISNTGAKMCDLAGYPILKFDGAQSVPPVIEDSKPQAVTSLKPGGKGYAAAILSAGDGSGGEGRTAQSLQIGFQGSDKFADAALQAKGVHIDDKLRVTYWLTSSADALTS
ncbi:DUF4232 domain-containing protein [Streptomyces flavofungini]|uniref:DUF4232 domain-containing protein n=1 Tax=Streptomyces flavofungini TaxID=68200 RepID=A0ABS0XG94_9ACTN|nr:DUF4232 domain-containing protein [Streptomyces flavofungini]MBJ3812213.1 DUF4232 domain-containing protein [Streptomyces flavofungini]GHC71388.1 hypothetical protein GCM10010349_47940 [Streptomyces flavofungini]